jgi:gluconate 2-dehydrogenase gamma chain
MPKHDPNRRAFLVRAAVGAGAAAAGDLVPDALARHPDQDAKAKAETTALTQPHANIEGRGAFFNRNDALTVEAFTERLMPGAPGKPGARDAGVLNYIDLALGGSYAELQYFYRRGLAQLDAYCRKTYNEPFQRLDAAQQDEVITALQEGKATGFTWPTAQALFDTVRTHTLEGMFADPIYGGNKDFAGWQLVGFPGVQMTFTPADLKSKEAFTRAPIIGLQGRP